MAEKIKKFYIPRMAMHILVLLYGVACIWLYYNQSVADLTAEPIRFEADLPLHISMVVEDHWFYSFTAFAYVAFYYLCGKTTYGIVVFLAAMSAGSVYMTEKLILTLENRDGKLFGKSELGADSLAQALALNFVMPAYIRAVGEFRYVSYQSASVWHNSTYICMKFFAIWTFIEFIKLFRKYREGISVKEWIYFAVLNVITTGIKPSFLVAYSPILAGFFVYDLIRRVPFKRILAFGSALLPSGVVIIWQQMVLFGDNTGNGVSFNPWYAFSLHGSIPKLAVICSAAFPGLVLIFVLFRIKEFCTRDNIFIILHALIAFAEALCLVEAGSRAVDGNFLWGYSFALFIWFVLSLTQFKKLGKAAKCVCGAVFAYQLWCGLYFFINLVCGVSYWMR